MTFMTRHGLAIAHALMTLIGSPATLSRPTHPGDARNTDHPERGDVPGWVMITVMTAALVLAILAVFEDAIVSAVQNALTSVTGAGAG